MAYNHRGLSRCTASSIPAFRIKDEPSELPVEQVVRVIEQKPNADYPKTAPKGDNGKGVWIH